ncbi:MAG: PAS domain S-box protein, partial [Planctomycetales bacterium]|nr:PAS domain S-box protein [Planctomycetales bacterium]
MTSSSDEPASWLIGGVVVSAALVLVDSLSGGHIAVPLVGIAWLLLLQRTSSNRLRFLSGVALIIATLVVGLATQAGLHDIVARLLIAGVMLLAIWPRFEDSTPPAETWGAEEPYDPLDNDSSLRVEIADLERQRDQLALREGRMRLTVERSLDAIITIDALGIVVEWNPNAESLFGWKADEIIGRDLAEMVIPEQHRRAHRVGLRDFRRTGVAKIIDQRMELTALKRTGEEFPVELTVVPIRQGDTIEFSAFVRDLSERKVVLQKLHDRELQVSNLLNSTAEGILGVDTQERCTFINPSGLRLLGLESPDQVLGRQVIDVLGGELVPERRELESLRRALAEGRETHADEATFRRAADVRFSAEYWSYPVRHDGELTGAVVTFLDITDRKRLERKVTAMVESAPIAMVMIDRTGAISLVNSQTESLFGYDRSELLGQPVEILLPDRIRLGHPQVREMFFDSPEARQMGQGRDLKGRRKDGSEFPVEIGLNPVPTQDGTMVLSAIADITERKRIEEAHKQFTRELENMVAERSGALQETLERLELALTNANVGLWDWNNQTGDVYYSDTFKKQLGYGPETPFSKFTDWESRLHPEDRAAALDLVERYLTRRMTDYQSTFRMRCRDGTYRWIQSEGRATFDEQDQPQRMIGVHIDITDRIETQLQLSELNEALQTANDALAQSNTELQQFAYVASHDLQTPLRSIAGFAQFLQEEYAGNLGSNADDYINRIVQGCHRMQSLISDLLAYSRVESRGAPFECVDLNQAVEDARLLLTASIDETQAEVTWEELPRVVGDPAQVSQLLLNLIGNAIKYHGAEPPVVNLAASIEEDRVHLEIRDNGIGIDPAHHERIFEIFRRLHTSTEYPGTGIGL